MKKTLPVDLLKLDGGTQSRISIDEDTVAEYAELIEASEDWPFPPLDVFHDGTDHFVADGFHRTLGASRAKRSSLPCVIHKGTATDARIFGMTANDRHGLRMTRADKRACVEWLLDNGGKMTQREIAEKAGVSKRMVSFIVADRREVDITPTPPKPVTPRGNAQIAHTPPEGPADESIPDDVFGDRHDEPPAKPGPTQPLKKYDRSSYLRQWSQAIGPVRRLVDSIARGVDEMHSPLHEQVKTHLESATETVETWME